MSNKEVKKEIVVETGFTVSAVCVKRDSGFVQWKAVFQSHDSRYGGSGGCLASSIESFDELMDFIRREAIDKQHWVDTNKRWEKEEKEASE